MNVRPASFRDLAGIERLYRASVDNESQTSPLAADSPVPQATLLRLWHAVSHSISTLMPLTDSGDVLFVAEDRGDVIGFIQAQVVPGRPKVLQIVNLCTTSERHGHFARERLLTALCNRGMESGITRLIVRIPAEHVLVPVFLEQGFSQIATEQILFIEETEVLTTTVSPDILRPARRDDVGALYLLYLRVTPSQIASIEASSQKMWQTTYAGGIAVRLGRDDVRHFVAERSGIYAWGTIGPFDGPRPTVMTLMCEGHDNERREQFIDAMLAELPPGPATCVLRHYDSELIRALQARGFAIYGTQLLLVRDLAVKVKLRAAKSREKPVLVAASVARAIPPAMLFRGDSPGPLYVVNAFADKGTQRSLRK